MLVALLCFVLALGCGTWFLRNLQLEAGEKLFAAFGIGSFVLGILGFALSHLHAFNATSAIAVMVAASLLTLMVSRELFREFASLLRWTYERLFSEGRWARVYAVFFIFYFVVLILLADTPARSGDAMRYHLAQLKDMLDHGGFIFRPYLSYHYPQYFSFVFFPAFIFGGGIGMKFAVLLTFALSLFAMLKIAERIGVKSLRCVAAILMLIPLTYQEATIVINDWPVCAYILCAVFTLLVLLERGQMRFALIAYICMGMALGTKHQAVLVVPWIIYLHWSKHDGSGREKVRDIAVGLAAMALVASPFYFRNYYYFGNPLWPLMQQVFPPRGDYLDLVARNVIGSLTAAPHSLSTAVSTLRGIILHPLIPCTVWIMGLVAVILTRSRLHIGTGFILFFGLWWIVTPEFYWRLSIYMLPFAVMAIGMLLDHLRQRRLLWGLKLLHLGIAITLLYGVGIGVWYSKGLLAWHTEEGRKNYHHATFYHDEYMWINENLPEDAKLMVFVATAHTFYLDREYVRADPKLSAGVDWRRVRTLEAFLAELRELEIDYVLFSRGVLGIVEEAKHLPQLIDDLIASDSADVVWTHNDVKLFRSRIRGVYTTDDVTLLKISTRKAAASM